MSKVSPKYPRPKSSMRLLLPGAVLLTVVALAYVYVDMRSERQMAQDFDRLAESVVAGAGQESEGKPVPPAGSANTAQLPPHSNATVLPRILPQPEIPTARPTTDAAAPSQAGTAPEGVPAQPSLDALPSQSVPAPFAEMSLEQLSALFARRYAGVRVLHWGEHLPGIAGRLDISPQESDAAAAADPQAVPATKTSPVLAVTLDACGGKKGLSYDDGIIAFLREKKIPATIFVTSIWIRNNPEALADLAADPLFEIAAHGSRHKPCSVNGNSAYGIKGTASFSELLQEVEGNARDIALATGRRPRWFRSGTAFYDDVAVRVIRDLGLGIAGYSIAGDEGATLSVAKVAAKTLKAQDGDILLYHLNHPKSGTREGLERALPVLLEQGYTFVRLSPDPLSPGP